MKCKGGGNSDKGVDRTILDLETVTMVTEVQ